MEARSAHGPLYMQSLLISLWAVFSMPKCASSLESSFLQSLK